MKQLISIMWMAGFSFLIFLCYSCKSSQASKAEKDPSEIYKCLPCGSECDKETYNHAGECPRCNMKLVRQASIVFRTVEPKDICAYIKNNPATILLDVRTREEFEGNRDPDFGTLKNAMNIPIQELENKLDEIQHLKNKEIVVFCSHSHRSPRASYLLTENGFTNVINMNGGMSQVTDTSCKK